MGETRDQQRVIECVVFEPRQFADLIDCQSAEVAHFMAEINIILLIARLFRGMSSEYQSLTNFFDIFIVLLVEPETSADSMGLIQVVEIGLETKLVDQLRPAYAQQDKLSDFGSDIGIVQPVSDRL